MTREMERTELIAREGIRDLLGRYTWAGDGGRVDDVAECFTDDGVLDLGDHGGVLEGRAAIAAELSAVVARAADAGWRIRETDVPYAPRKGRSKVTGTWRGTWQAVHDMSAVLTAPLNPVPPTPAATVAPPAAHEEAGW